MVQRLTVLKGVVEEYISVGLRDDAFDTIIEQRPWPVDNFGVSISLSGRVEL